jgi:hypothetical protein
MLPSGGWQSLAILLVSRWFQEVLDLCLQRSTVCGRSIRHSSAIAHHRLRMDNMGLVHYNALQ